MPNTRKKKSKEAFEAVLQCFDLCNKVFNFLLFQTHTLKESAESSLLVVVAAVTAR